MAYIRAHDTTQKRNGKTVKRYEVAWREQATDANGLPIPGRMRSRQESYPTRELAEARRDELNNAKHNIGGTSALADAKKAGELPFGDYAASWLDGLATRVADPDDKLKTATAAKYKRLLEFYVLPDLGGTPVATINAARCRKFRAALVNRSSRVGGEDARLSASSIKHVWAVFRAVLDLAVGDGALQRNPASGTDFRRKRGTGDRARFKHRPLRPAELGALCAALEGQPATGDNGSAPALPPYPVYALMVEFMAATGLRASEVAGLEVADLLTYPIPVGAPRRMAISVARAKERKNGVWVMHEMLKSEKSRRTVPLPGWLAEKMADYLKTTHQCAKDDAAPLWPGRSATVVAHVGKRRQTVHNWDEPVDMPTFYRRVFRPALLAAGLPASEPATPATKDTPARAAAKGVRLHDLRHTFAALQITNGQSPWQVSQWLGHADLAVTMSVYADYMPEEPAANTLPEPPRPTAPITNVVSLSDRAATG
jgi:integrase